MSDQRIAEFRERAELGVTLPDLAHLERRGHALHRRRQASVLGGLVLALVAGYGLISTLPGDPDASPSPTNPWPHSSKW